MGLNDDARRFLGAVATRKRVSGSESNEACKGNLVSLSSAVMLAFQQPEDPLIESIERWVGSRFVQVELARERKLVNDRIVAVCHACSQPSLGIPDRLGSRGRIKVVRQATQAA